MERLKARDIQTDVSELQINVEGVSDARTFEILGDLKNARDMYAKVMDQSRGCHTCIDPFVKRKFADISFDLGHYSSAILEMYLSLAR